MSLDLKPFFDNSTISALDWWLADELTALLPAATADADRDRFKLAVMLLGWMLDERHSCLDSALLAGKTKFPRDFVGTDGADSGAGAPVTKPGDIDLPSLAEWRETFSRLGAIIGTPQQDGKPLILDARGDTHFRLYLRRYYRYESTVAEHIRGLVQAPGQPVDPGLLDRHFPQDDGQKQAARTALAGRFAVISGGPGTGKTTTVVRILAMLLEPRLDLRIAVAAPTGKAAARVNESVGRQIPGLQSNPAVTQRLTELKAVTLHRLLGASTDGLRFAFNPDHPIPADVVLVDEASMVPLPLFHRLLAALEPRCRLILLGDMHQLASVEPGAVLGDICQAARAAAGKPLGQSVVELKVNYRFPADSPIGQASAAINAGQPDKAWKALGAAGSLVTVREELPERLFTPGAVDSAFKDMVKELFGPFRAAETAAAALQALERVRILCALRRGPYGVEAINRLAEFVLLDNASGRPRTRIGRYHRQPIMVTKNDYGNHLFNGDIGVVWKNADTGRYEAHFPDPEDSTKTRAFAVAALTEFETVYAMTVHKAQGSEFAQMALLLPPGDPAALAALLTRELLYTAVTRLSVSSGKDSPASHLHLWCQPEVFAAAVRRVTVRASGLADRLADEHLGQGET